METNIRMHGTSELVNSTHTRPVDGPAAINIILIDNHMRNMDGPAATKIIRKLGFKGLIIGVTDMMDDVAEVFTNAGANLVLGKPINLVSLMNSIRVLEQMQKQ